MSAAHRSLARLPLNVYSDLIRGRADKDHADNPSELRRKICNKLKKFPPTTTTMMRGGGGGKQLSSSNINTSGSCNSNNNNEIVHESVTTVGQLLTRTSKLTLLRVLDPLLTYGAYLLLLA